MDTQGNKNNQNEQTNNFWQGALSHNSYNHPTVKSTPRYAIEATFTAVRLMHLRAYCNNTAWHAELHFRNLSLLTSPRPRLRPYCGPWELFLEHCAAKKLPLSLVLCESYCSIPAFWPRWSGHGEYHMEHWDGYAERPGMWRLTPISTYPSCGRATIPASYL
jgi:hypothetical protein